MLRALVVVSILAGCGGGGSGGGGGGKGATAPAAAPTPVALGDWCKGLVPPACKKVSSCAGAPDMEDSCTSSGIESCIAGRDPAKPSGHDSAQLQACITLYSSAACQGYGETLSSHTECQASE